MPRLPLKPDKTETNLYNPDTEEFNFSYDGGRESYNFHAMSYESFPKYIADKMASLLADKIIGKMGIKQNYMLDKQKLLDRIYIKHEQP